MQPRWPPTFNVIYVPRTVRFLTPFVRSLVANSTYRFRLVANACSAAEEALLADEALRHANVEVSSLETPRVLSHGEALQRCFANESDDYFACVDSDIFARAPFLSGAQTLLADCAGVFCGRPCWLTEADTVMPDGFAFMSGRFSTTQSGQCLGTSYCMIYRRPELETVMARTGVTFHARSWFDLSSEQRASLSEMELAKRRYDTGKLVNLMLGRDGFSLAMSSEPNLVHVGALSSDAMRPPDLVGRVARRIRESIDEYRPAPVARRGALERATAASMFARRQLVEAYVRHLLAGGRVDDGLVLSFPLPVRQQMREMGAALLAVRDQIPTSTP